jgi:hypothetical protein
LQHGQLQRPQRLLASPADGFTGPVDSRYVRIDFVSDGAPITLGVAEIEAWGPAAQP